MDDRKENNLVGTEDVDSTPDEETEPVGLEFDAEEDSSESNRSELYITLLCLALVSVFVIFVGVMVYKFGTNHGAEISRLTKDVVISMIEAEFNEADAEYLIRKATAYQIEVLDYSLFGSATIFIQTYKTPVDDGAEADKQGVTLDLQYNYYKHTWEIEDLDWPHRPICTCDCGRCLYNQDGGVDQ